MKNLIIPMGGKSSRFPGMRPKWILTHPSTGNLMCVESIQGINIDFFDKIYFVILKEHEELYGASLAILKSISNTKLGSSVIDKVNVVILENPTSSQSETVYMAIMKEDIEGFIYIKDSDGYFKCNIDSTNNQVTYFDLNNTNEINARSKSYVELDSNYVITNMVEKKVISSNFCVGGYGFNSSIEFCNYYNKIWGLPGECYISNIIFEMILEGEKFTGKESSDFLDWGTIKSWNDYKSKMYTVFSDLDGTLLTNTSHLIPPYIGEGEPMINNIKVLQEIKENGGFIIITTSRPEEYRDITIKELNTHDIPHDMLIMGLPHSQRILINDFAKSNPYPSCSSINIQRDSDTINQYLKIR
jgi:hypothetical protein